MTFNQEIEFVRNNVKLKARTAVGDIVCIILEDIGAAWGIVQKILKSKEKNKYDMYVKILGFPPNDMVFDSLSSSELDGQEVIQGRVKKLIVAVDVSIDDTGDVIRDKSKLVILNRGTNTLH